ncbi:MAG: sulfatase, partial [Thermoanaerobaculia bacterium]|nr:sulfatase [Thermoanaerobaculia bacterium]
ALRADSLGPYGSGRATTPFLDRLAARATLFENAFAQVPSTLPSHMSMFTGLYPSEHQVDPPSSVLSDQIRTLPEVLRKAGFRTFGHTEGGYVQGGYGFARGFEEWSDTPYAHDTDVERTFRAGLDSLAKVRDGERFFLFLHSYTVHDPYEPPPAYRSLPWIEPRPAGAFDPTGPNLAGHNEHRVTATPEAIEWFRGLYDAGVRYLDDQLAAFFAELERTGLADETVVILTSDHGEGGEARQRGAAHATQDPIAP